VVAAGVITLAEVGSDKLTEARKIAPYLWVHPDDER
jgi:hypothetical protein